MNVLLVYPPLNEYTNYWTMHLGLGYISAVLTSTGHRITVLDCVAEKKNFNKFKEFIKAKDFDIVGITATTNEIFNAHEIAKIVKAKNSNILTILGGPHCTALPKETLAECPNFDVLIIGEGEYTILEVIDQIENGGNFEKIRGICFRKEDTLILNEKCSPNMNLDKLPFPQWENFTINNYRSFLGINKKIEFPMSSGRGCPNFCVFCQSFLGRIVRLRDFKLVVDEIEHNISLGAKSIHFCDETFTLSQQRTMDLSDEIMRRGIHKKITWHCETRVDTVTLEMLKKMKDAGCAMVNYGVESGNDIILKNSKKGITVAQIVNAFKWSKMVGLKTYMNLIFGHPGETNDTIQDTINLMMKINPDYVTIGIMTPFPGTELLDMAKRGEHGLQIISQAWDKYSKQDSSALSVNDLTNNDLKRWQSKAYSKFYMRPSKIFNLLELANMRGLFQMVINRIKSDAY